MPNLIKILRIQEVILMTGFFLIGSFFSINDYNVDVILKLVLIGKSSFLIILAHYCYNSAAGKSKDNKNDRLKSLKLLSAKSFYYLAYIFLILALLFAFLIHWHFSLTCLIIFLIWKIYAHPTIGLKHRPYWGTVLHFFAQIIHFNMCYAVFNDIGINSISISIYFSIAFAAGHLHHEIIDYKPDKKSGSVTTVVKHGINSAIMIIIILYALNLVLTSILYFFDFIDMIIYIVMLIPVIFQFILYSIYSKNIYNKAIAIRTAYRAAYFIAFSTIVLYNIIATI